MKFWQVLVLFLIMTSIVVGLITYVVVGTMNKVREIGLKNIISDVWEGEKADK